MVDSDTKVKTIGGGVRNSNLEILRILCMILIILHHICQNTFPPYPDDPTITVLVSMIGRSSVGKIGVIAFVLITGYFMVTQTITLKKVLKLLAEVWFYSFATTLFAILILHQDISMGLIQSTLFPIITHRYWFITGYIFLIILSPFINRCLNNISAKEHFVLCVFLILVSYGLRMIDDSFYLSEYSTFVVIYTIAAFIRLHPQEIFTNLKNSIILLIGSSSTLLLLSVMNVFMNYDGPQDFGLIPKMAIVVLAALALIYCVRRKNGKMTNAFFALLIILMIVPHFVYLGYRDYTYLISLNNTLTSIDFVVALALFLVFLNMKPCYNKMINWFATSILAVYLIQGTVFGSALHWFNAYDWFYTGLYPFYILGVAVVTLMGCVMIDKVREYLIFRPLSKPFGKLYDLIESRSKDIWSRMKFD